MDIIQELGYQIDHRNQLGYLLKRLNYKNCLELGVQKGEFSSKILEGHPDLQLYLIDAWRQFPNYIDVANVSQNNQNANYLSVIHKFINHFNVTIIRGASLEISHIFAKDSLDSIYIDANHSYEAFYNDLEAWYDKVRKGGLFAGHDYIDDGIYGGTKFGVKSALHDFLKKNNIGAKLYLTKEHFATWYFVK